MKKLAICLLATLSVTALAQDRIAKFDMNNDGKVDFIEITSKCTVSKALFDRADKNGDGVLSEAEMRTAKEYLFTKCQNEIKNA